MAARDDVEVVVREATAELQADVDRVLEGRRGPDGCWCQRFRAPTDVDHRAALHRELDASPRPIGLIALVDGEPAGWSRVAPRADLPGITGNRALARVLDVPDDAWWITCFTLRPRFRGIGVGRHLLRAAVEFTTREGGRVLDGHPVDVAALTKRPSASALFTGTLTTFLALGFEEIGRTFPTRPVMRRRLQQP